MLEFFLDILWLEATPIGETELTDLASFLLLDLIMISGSFVLILGKTLGIAGNDGTILVEPCCTNIFLALGGDF